MRFFFMLKPTTVIIFFLFHVIYNAAAIPTKIKAYCSDVELKKEKDLLKPPSFSCPKERSKHTLDAAVDKIFGGDKWWKKVFSNKKLKQAIKSCVVAPEKDCDGTAESCGVIIANNKENLRSRAFGICKQKRPLDTIHPSNNLHLFIKTVINTVSDKEDKISPTVVSILADEVSVTDLFLAFKKYGGHDQKKIKMGEDSISKGSPFSQYEWKSKLPEKAGGSCNFKSKIGWGVINEQDVQTIKFIDVQSSHTVYFQFVVVDKLLLNGNDDSYNDNDVNFKCSSLLIDVFNQISNVIIFNAADSNHMNDANKLKSNLQFLIKTFVSAGKSYTPKVRVVLALDSLPSHYPSKGRTGLLNHRSSTLTGIAPKFATCIYNGAIAPNEIKLNLTEDLKNDVSTTSIAAFNISVANLIRLRIK